MLSQDRDVKHDLASVLASVEECRSDNMRFFESFTASLEATQQGIEVMRVRLITGYAYCTQDYIWSSAQYSLPETKN